MHIIVGMLSAGNVLQMDAMRDQKVSNYNKQGIIASAIPPWMKPIVASILSKKSPKTARLLLAFGEQTTTSYYRHVAAAQLYKAKFQKAMDALQLDLLLCPAHPLPTHPRCTTKEFTPAAVYCALFNLLDYAAAAVPVTTLQPSDTWDPAEPIEDEKMDTALRKAYAQTLGTGIAFPVAVQMVARPFQEELLLRGLLELERAIPPPVTMPSLPRSAL